MMKVDIQKFLKDFSCLSWCFCSKIQTEITEFRDFAPYLLPAEVQVEGCYKGYYNNAFLLL